MRDGSTSEEKSAMTKVNGMACNVFLQLFREEFPYDLTSKQEEVACSLFDFLFSSDKMGVYILRGYAGTGKTLLVSALVRVLKKLQKDVVLLAPTGRAAKVLSILSISRFTGRERWLRKTPALIWIGTTIGMRCL